MKQDKTKLCLRDLKTVTKKYLWNVMHNYIMYNMLLCNVLYM